MGLLCFICWFIWNTVICSFLLQSGAHINIIVGCLGWCGTLPTFMTSVAKVDPRNVYGINVGWFMSERDKQLGANC